MLPFLAATEPAAARAMLEYRCRRLPAALAAARGRRVPGCALSLGVGRQRIRRHPPLRARPQRSRRADPHRRGRGAHRRRCCLGGVLLHRLDRRSRVRRRRRSGDSRRDRALLGVTYPCRRLGARASLRRDRARRVSRAGRRQRLHQRARALEPAPRGRVGGGASTTARSTARSCRPGYASPTRSIDGFDSLQPVSTRSSRASSSSNHCSSVTSRPSVRSPPTCCWAAERVRRAQIVKQTDVLMLHHLLPDEVEAGVAWPRTSTTTSRARRTAARCRRAFTRRCSLAPVGSTMPWPGCGSPPESTSNDLTRTGAGGVHLGAMGSVWQALAYGFAGLRPRGDALVVDPRLPDTWSGFELRRPVPWRPVGPAAWNPRPSS